MNPELQYYISMVVSFFIVFIVVTIINGMLIKKFFPSQINELSPGFLVAAWWEILFVVAIFILRVVYWAFCNVWNFIT